MDAPAAITQNVAWMKRQFSACQTPRSMYRVPIYLQQFPSYSNRKCKKSQFSRTAAHIFVSPADAPAIITQYVAWMESQFNACQTPRSVPSIFNSFPGIRTASAKNRRFHVPQPTFLFPLETPLRLSPSMWMKRIQFLPNPSQHVPIYLEYFPSYTMFNWMRKSKNR